MRNEACRAAMAKWSRRLFSKEEIPGSIPENHRFIVTQHRDTGTGAGTGTEASTKKERLTLAVRLRALRKEPHIDSYRWGPK
eukprot:1155875-Pelagomonas_calceolata.AAC.2